MTYFNMKYLCLYLNFLSSIYYETPYIAKLRIKSGSGMIIRVSVGLIDRGLLDELTDDEGTIRGSFAVMLRSGRTFAVLAWL